MVGLTKSGGGKKAKRSSGPSIFTKFQNINLDPSVIFQKKRAPPCPRSVYFNEPLPSEAFDKKGRPLKGKKGDANWTFATNQVLTAKYTVFNFIFKNLLEQFRRVANLFFLLLVILQFFPKFSTISPGLAMLPLLAVLAITALKDGYEDVKRHQSDRSINRLRVRALTGGGWTNPNVMEPKERSLSSFVRSFYAQQLGGKKRQSKHIAAEHTQHPSTPAVEGVDPIEPPVPAPGGGSAQPVLNRAMTSRSSLAGGGHLRRQSSIVGSLFGGSEYEHGADGRIRHRGRLLSPEEEAQYHAKRAPRWKKKMWEDLAVGDFVLLKNNEAVPADIVVCATSEEEDACFVETKNLDGETNLKSRHAVPELAQALRTAEDCSRILMRVDGEPLDTNMYRLNASVVLGERFDRDGQPVRCPVTLNQCLLRGCNVRNTEWIIGLVLMTGSDTKIIANSGNTPSKRGKVEKQMNPMVYFNLALLAIVAISCAIADSRIEHYYFDRAAYWEYLAIFSDDNPNLNGLTSFGNALITFQNIVPISLYISIEVVRTVQAYFIFDDYDIFYEPTMRRTTARSWNLSDDLGQIQYIFSDKTGTLTQNLMIFRELAVGGVTYHGDEPSDAASENEKIKEFNSDASGNSSEQDPRRKRVKPSTEGVPPFRDQRLIDALKDENSKHAQEQGKFWRCLALCHTVLTSEDTETGILEYKAQSPDEQALVQAAADVGFTFCGKDRQTLKIQTPWSLDFEKYELLAVLEFSSARKRMSVILRRESDKRIIIFSKGADSVMFERSAAGQDQLKADTDAALEEFANKGLRTLCLGYKEVEESVYEEWAHRYHDASVSLTEREEKMEELASELERDYVLLGATAIEDRLQDGVPETIADLKRAGINVWVATGDKLETAIAIGYSTMLLSKEMNLIVVRGGEYGQPNSAYEQLKKAIERFFGGPDVVEQMEHQPPDVEEAGSRRTSRLGRRPSGLGRRSQASATSLVGEDNGERPGGFALVIDGAALNHALTEEFSKELLLKLSTQCKAVICCRVSPLQKALIVRLIKDGLGVMTLAIGDGANDVSMIQAAHVGIGIAGEEGLQAVNSSDYAIAQFRYLKRLLLVHGHWSYYRNGTMILNFFYKEMINVGYLFWFQIYCAWSTTQAVDYVYLLFWNAFWTVALVIALGIFDRPISDRVLMEVPELYKRGREGRYFGLKPFLWYLLDGLYQATVLYFFISYSYDMTTARVDGFDIQLYEWSTTMAIASVLVANLYTALWCKAWTWWLFAGLWIGPVLIFVFAPIYAAFSPQTIWTYSYGNNHYLYPSAAFWFTGVLCAVLCLMPLFIFRHMRETYYPRDIDILRAVDKYDPKHDYVRDPRMPAMRVAKEYGLPISAFAGGESGNNTEAGLAPPNRQGAFAMHDLHPVTSRSSTHHDMLTGEDRPVRGFGFSSDEPQSARAAKRRSFKERFLPGTLRRKREQSKLSQMAPREEDDEEGVPETTADTNAPLNHPGPEDDEEDANNEPLPEQSNHTAPVKR